jgi:hypothetical protein
MKYKRDYHFKGVNPGTEQKRFWLVVLLGLLIAAAIVYLF